MHGHGKLGRGEQSTHDSVPQVGSALEHNLSHHGPSDPPVTLTLLEHQAIVDKYRLVYNCDIRGMNTAKHKHSKRQGGASAGGSDPMLELTPGGATAAEKESFFHPTAGQVMYTLYKQHCSQCTLAFGMCKVPGCGAIRSGLDDDARKDKLEGDEAAVAAVVADTEQAQATYTAAHNESHGHGKHHRKKRGHGHERTPEEIEEAAHAHKRHHHLLTGQTPMEAHIRDFLLWRGNTFRSQIVPVPTAVTDTSRPHTAVPPPHSVYLDCGPNPYDLLSAEQSAIVSAKTVYNKHVSMKMRHSDIKLQAKMYQYLQRRLVRSQINKVVNIYAPPPLPSARASIEAAAGVSGGSNASLGGVSSARPRNPNITSNDAVLECIGDVGAIADEEEDIERILRKTRGFPSGSTTSTANSSKYKCSQSTSESVAETLNSILPIISAPAAAKANMAPIANSTSASSSAVLPHTSPVVVTDTADTNTAAGVEKPSESVAATLNPAAVLLAISTQFVFDMLGCNGIDGRGRCVFPTYNVHDVAQLISPYPVTTKSSSTGNASKSPMNPILFRWILSKCSLTRNRSPCLLDKVQVTVDSVLQSNSSSRPVSRGPSRPSSASDLSLRPRSAQSSASGSRHSSRPTSASAVGMGVAMGVAMRPNSAGGSNIRPSSGNTRPTSARIRPTSASGNHQSSSIQRPHSGSQRPTSATGAMSSSNSRRVSGPATEPVLLTNAMGGGAYGSNRPFTGPTEGAYSGFTGEIITKAYMTFDRLHCEKTIKLHDHDHSLVVVSVLQGIVHNDEVLQYTNKYSGCPLGAERFYPIQFIDSTLKPGFTIAVYDCKSRVTRCTTIDGRPLLRLAVSVRFPVNLHSPVENYPLLANLFLGGILLDISPRATPAALQNGLRRHERYCPAAYAVKLNRVGSLCTSVTLDLNRIRQKDQIGGQTVGLNTTIQSLYVHHHQFHQYQHRYDISTQTRASITSSIPPQTANDAGVSVGGVGGVTMMGSNGPKIPNIQTKTNTNTSTGSSIQRNYLTTYVTTAAQHVMLRQKHQQQHKQTAKARSAYGSRLNVYPNNITFKTNTRLYK